MKELAGVISASTTSRFPQDFHEQALGNLRGTVWSADTRESITVTFDEYVNSSLHLQASCVMCGDPALGKTPLLYAVCGEFALRYNRAAEHPHEIIVDNSGGPVIYNLVIPGDGYFSIVLVITPAHGFGILSLAIGASGDKYHEIFKMRMA